VICVPQEVLEQKAKKMPIAYMADCKAAATISGGQWCFSVKDYQTIRQKYRGYAVSESDRFVKGERISGCCDRADQY
jgi:hypothetical protein